VEIEDYLAKFRAVSPPADLRGRVLRARRPRRSWWLAAAALLVVLWAVNGGMERGLEETLRPGAGAAASVHREPASLLSLLHLRIALEGGKS
jgi:hypothetical protein